MDVTSLFNGLTQVNLATWIVGITVCVLVLRLRNSTRARSPPLPPSPRFCLPILGHLLQVNIDVRVTFRKFRKQFGDIYSFYMGSQNTVIISGFGTIKEAFKTRSLFVDRTQLDLLDITSRKMGIATVNGPLWREHRIFALSTLKDFGLGRRIIEDKINEETKLLLQAIKMEEERPFDPKETVATAVSNIICSMAFGHTFKHGDAKFNTLVQAFTEMNTAIGKAGIVTILPFLAKFPGDPFRMQQMSRDTDARFAFIREIIDEHLQNYDENVIEDYTSAFIKAMKQKQLNNETTTFTLDQLSGVIADLFFAGTGTTAAALRWSLACLINFPETQTRMYDVISKHVGIKRLPSLEDKPAISYAEAFYMEVLRYCEITTSSLYYDASDDVTMNGFTIPKGSIVIADLDSVLQDPNIWGDPDNFRPDRFLNEDGSIRTQEELIPFFMGKRRCLGESMARMELFLFLSAMVQNYVFESPDGDDVSVRSVDGLFGIVHEPKPFRIVARARHA